MISSQEQFDAAEAEFKRIWDEVMREQLETESLLQLKHHEPCPNCKSTAFQMFMKTIERFSK